MARDPVCGMTVADDSPLLVALDGQTWRFCSEGCRQRFLQTPQRWLVSPPTERQVKIAYFSMEIALEPGIPTYSGGLGILAGDTLRACADAEIPLIGVSLVYRHGYFRQSLTPTGDQVEAPAAWAPETTLSPMQPTVEVEIGDRKVRVMAWQYRAMGAAGRTVPVLLLDTDLPENRPEDRVLTDRLYGGDQRYRLAQEIVLGIGGVRILEALGHTQVRTWHMNEGHSGLLAFELLRRSRKSDGLPDFDAVRHGCVFTTHTPVPAGQDRFDWRLVREMISEPKDMELLRMLCGDDLNMTRLALNTSHYVNGVAMRHREVSHTMFPGYPIDSITNGVHTWTWATDPLRALFDRHVPGWRTDPAELRHALSIPRDDVWQAHVAARAALDALVQQRTGQRLEPARLTLGLARRMTQYKRNDLIFHDCKRLRAVAAAIGGLQIVLGGKAHPRDEAGKAMVRHIAEVARELQPEVRVVFLEDYDMAVARVLIGGVDAWLNTPRKPNEASGTSGMKAALNGVPHFSVLDGWWLEGHIEGVTGWSIGTRDPQSGDDASEAEELYARLEGTIAPMFRHDRSAWIDVMRHAIAVNGAYFNAQRMVQQYAVRAYLG